MRWEYRVVRNKSDNRYWFDIREVYDDGEGWTMNEIAPAGETLDELRNDLIHMLVATSKPVLEEKNGRLVKVKESKE